MGKIEYTRLNIETLAKIAKEAEQKLDELYSEGISGTYIIEKVEGTNNENFQTGYTFRGYSRGIVKGLSMQLGNVSNWFHTSPVEEVTWHNENSGTFKTKNSIYKFRLL